MNMGMKHYKDVEKFRILLNFENSIRKICKIVVSKKDISLYLIPYGKSGIYYYGEGLIKEGKQETTFNYTTKFKSSDIPKLSIHQSGQVHIYSKSTPKAGPLMTLPLFKFQGEHLATITVDNFYNLPIYNEEIKAKERERDIVLQSEKGVESGRIIVYLNSVNNKFWEKCWITLRVKRENNLTPLFFCFHLKAQKPLVKKGKGGVIVIGGWNPRTNPHKPFPFLYIKTE